MPTRALDRILTATTTAALLVAGTGLTTPAARLPDPGAEPPLLLELTVGEQVIELVEGQPAAHELLGQEVTLRAEVRPTRRLQTPACSFDYPRHMAFEYERDADLGLETWTLDGNDVVLMAQRFDVGSARFLARSILEATTQALGAEPEIESTRQRCGGEQMPAFVARSAIAGVGFEQTAVAIDTSEGPVVLLLQVTAGEGDAPAAEAAQVKALLDSSFEYQRKRDE